MICPRCSALVEEGARFCSYCGSSVPGPRYAVEAREVAPTDGPKAPSPAHCVVHPGQEATGVCGRCGAFTCSACAQAGSDLCPTCRVRVGADAVFPLTRERWSLGDLLDIAWRRFRIDWVMLSLSGLAVMAVVMGVSMVGQIGQYALTAAAQAIDASTTPVVLVGMALFSMSLQTLAQGVMILGLVRLCVESLHGRKLELGLLFSQLRKLGKVFVQGIVVFLAILIPFGAYGGLVALAIYLTGGFEASARVAIIAVASVAIAIVPFLYWSSSFYFAQMELACNDEIGAIDSIRNSFAIARGQRLAVVGVAIVAGLMVSAGVFACCIGVFASLALGQMVLVGLYLALRNGSGLPPLSLLESRR